MNSPVIEPIADSFKSLLPNHPLSLAEDACLPLRAPRYATCRACEEICPSKSLKLAEDSLRLDENCLHCGRCTAACPMGALRLPGFSVPSLERLPAPPVSIDCWKVPAKLSLDDGFRVPCIGGLSTGRILEIVAQAGARVVELLDRGWCAGCSAGCATTHPVSASLQHARELMEAAGSGSDRLPYLRKLHLPSNLMPIDIPPPESETKLSRRGFFGALTAKATLAIDQVKPLAPQIEARRRRGFERDPVPSRERKRLLGSITQIGRNAWLAPPPNLFTRIEISDACSNHQLCASICPTGALSIVDSPGKSEIMFDTQLCISCGECRAICPSGALTVLPNGYNEGADTLPDHPTRISTFSERSCIQCGQSFAERAAEELCPQCRKRAQLARSAFQFLFRPRE